MKNLTVIIPTYNRLEKLMRVLKGLDNQSYNLKNVEVLVMDDHSSIDPKNEIQKLKTKYELNFVRGIKNIGQGMVRNNAIDRAKGEYVLFIGDDTFPKTDFLTQHMSLHNKSKGVAVLGKVVWAEEVRNKFMNYLEGIQFHYNNIKDKENVKMHFYTSNISLEKKWFENEKYSSQFRNYGLEDIEIGYRLEQKGLRVVYNEHAIVYHDHSYTFEGFCHRMENVGKSAVIFTRIHPELKRRYIPYFYKIIKIFVYILSNKNFKRLNRKMYWYANFVYYYLRGLENELKT